MGAQPFVDWPKDPDHLKPAFIARQLRMSPEAIKARIAKMERAGHIVSYEIYPNLSLLGLSALQFSFFPKQRISAETRPRILRVDGVGGFEMLLGGGLMVELYGRTEPEIHRRAQVVADLLGGATPEAVFRYPQLPSKRPLTTLEWRIVRALRGRANRPLSAVAKELKVSARTVKRNFDRMWREGSIDTFVILNVGDAPNTLFCALRLTFRAGTTPPPIQRLTKTFEDRWCYCHVPPDSTGRQLILGLVVGAVGDLDSCVERAHAVDGVVAVDAWVSTRFLYNQAWLDEAIDAQLPAQPMSKSPRKKR